MNYVLRGGLASLTLLAAGVGAVSLETSLFEDASRPPESSRAANIARVLGDGPVLDEPVVLGMQWDADAVGLHVSYDGPGPAGASSSPSDTPKVARPSSGAARQCVCPCRARCARRFLRHCRQ